MLDHDDERRLAEIEDRLRLDDPEWSRLFELPAVPRSEHSRERRTDVEPPEPTPPHPVVGSVLSFIIAVLATTFVTLVFGPNLGGLVAVVSLCIAGMYSYQVLRGCPGLRHRDEHGDDGGTGDDPGDDPGEHDGPGA